VAPLERAKASMLPADAGLRPAARRK
jgi:hypothetical protein